MNAKQAYELGKQAASRVSKALAHKLYQTTPRALSTKGYKAIPSSHPQKVKDLLAKGSIADIRSHFAQDPLYFENNPLKQLMEYKLWNQAAKSQYRTPKNKLKTMSEIEKDMLSAVIGQKRTK